MIDASGDSEKLRAIVAAVRDYHFGLDSREHGGILGSRLVDRVRDILGMPWRQGEEKERRRAMAEAGDKEPEITFEIHRDYEEFWNMNAPDERWTFTDAAGHIHRYGSDDDPYPTLVERSERVEDWDEDGEDASYNRTWHECRLCGEVIRPGTTERMESIPGLIHYWVNGKPVMKDEYDRLFAEFKAAREAAR